MVWLLPDGSVAVQSAADSDPEFWWRTQISLYDPETGQSTKPRKAPHRQALIEALPDGRMLLGRTLEETCPNFGAYEPTRRLGLFDPRTGETPSSRTCLRASTTAKASFSKTEDSSCSGMC